MCARPATEVVSLDIRSKIRYDATTAGIPVETQDVASPYGHGNGNAMRHRISAVETRCIASYKRVNFPTGENKISHGRK